LPARGVHLKDLILLHTALPDWHDDVYVNFRKMAQLSMIFTELMQVQNATLPIEPNMDLVNTLRVRNTFSALTDRWGACIGGGIGGIFWSGAGQKMTYILLRLKK